ncbi:MAG: hypothetical protein ACFFBP_02815 [Promethearchaeota archaeon]
MPKTATKTPAIPKINPTIPGALLSFVAIPTILNITPIAGRINHSRFTIIAFPIKPINNTFKNIGAIMATTSPMMLKINPVTPDPFPI